MKADSLSKGRPLHRDFACQPLFIGLRNDDLQTLHDNLVFASVDSGRLSPMLLTPMPAMPMSEMNRAAFVKYAWASNTSMASHSGLGLQLPKVQTAVRAGITFL